MRHIQQNAALFLLALGLAAPAQAADCSGAQIQADMDECAGNEVRQADARLNTLYGDLQRRLKGDPDTAKLLTAAQRAWIAYRDAECGFSSSGTIGGSVHGMIEAQCRTGLTQARSKDFTAYLSCQEGDLSCPVPGK